MRINFTKAQTIKIIQAYYKMYEERDVEVEIDASKGCEGFYETSCVNVKITAKSKISVLGEQVEVEEVLDKTKVNNIFKTILNEEEYDVKNIYYDAGITTIDERYGNSYTGAYFNGINVEVKSIKKQKIKQI